MEFVIGVDEAGRGPIAGPVSVGVVMVPRGFNVAIEFPGVADSKKLSEKKREKLFSLLEERAKQGDVCFSVEFGSHEAIDAIGISPVIADAVSRGVNAVSADSRDAFVYLDGSLRAPKEYAQETVIGGDASMPIISLASIAAKVVRDRLMVGLAAEHPLYGFEKHKGYGTKSHYEALGKHGPCAIHRTSFLHLVKE